jgi:hypothetical protein
MKGIQHVQVVLTVSVFIFVHVFQCIINVLMTSGTTLPHNLVGLGTIKFIILTICQ